MSAAIYLAIPFALAVLVIVADWLDWHGTLGPAWLLRLPARLVMPHTGHHRDKYATETPAPQGSARQVPRPGDPRGATRAVRAGATPLGPGGAPVPPAAATAAPPAEAATLPRPVPSPGPGQPSRQPWLAYDARRPTWEVLTDGDDPAAFEHASRRVTGTAFQPGIRETGAQPALERPAARRHFEHIDDAVVTLP